MEKKEHLWKRARLIPNQNEEYELLKSRYDSKIAEVDNLSTEDTDKRISSLISAARASIFGSYLPFLSKKYSPFDIEPASVDEMKDRIRIVEITKWVTDPSEDNLEKLANVYQSFSNEACNIALIIKRDSIKCRLFFALVETNEDASPSESEDLKNRALSVFSGNFPGSEISDSNEQIVSGLPYISSVCCLASEKSDNFICQTIEKLIDGIVPEKTEQNYTLILLAESISDFDSLYNDITIKYSALCPYATVQSNKSSSDSYGINSTASRSFNFGGHLGFEVFAGLNFGGNWSSTLGIQKNATESTGVTRTYTDYSVKHMLDVLEKQMQRLDICKSTGMWNFSGYILSDDITTTESVAHTYASLVAGPESFILGSSINVWHDLESRERLVKYLSVLQHPLFFLKENTDSFPALASATNSISSIELAHAMNMPRKSIPGLPVIECASFGRNIVHLETDNSSSIELGQIYHMNRVEKAEVSLSKETLASHTFITGSTGSGKSNTVFHLLNKCIEEDVRFLVVEPVKGEYKEVFGHIDNVFVYGTNPNIGKLLRINPFSFPKSVHVFEHLDRLTELFNVCWPMYAAMPAVLKNALEKSYEDCGWDLICSANRYGERLFPSFKDVAKNVKEIIESSDYDNDNKGAYKGALITRINSLTNGVFGIIFNSNEISEEEIFEKNVIIDLSRVGSSETKSLIMGMMVLKLQEYHTGKASAFNSELKHITVLEEAHTILKKTSPVQSPDTSSLQGKSVEMISNAIAEMRSFGEGFIIVDQAPNLLDMAAIRNTNTKIIMRLPDYTDRELVGRSANLNDDQLKELSKLPRGVAAVFQTGWIQPVLCKIDKAPISDYKYESEKDDIALQVKKGEDIENELLQWIMSYILVRDGNKEDLVGMKSQIIESDLKTTVKVDYLDFISERDDDIASLRKLLYDIVDATKAIDDSRQIGDFQEWTKSVLGGFNPSIGDFSSEQINAALGLILYEHSKRDISYRDVFCRFTELLKKGEGIS